MKRYLKTISRKEAQRIILEKAERIREEELIPSYQCTGRVTSRPVFGKISNPCAILSAMDGYAVNCAETQGADISNPLRLKKFDEAYPLNTGDPLPVGKDAVFMVEEVEERGDYIVIRKPAFLWQNVRMVGEDTIEGELILPQYHVIDPFDVGLLISSGVTHVHVLRRPNILIVPTGAELIDPYEEGRRIEKKGVLYDFNSYVLSSLAESIGFNVKRTKIAKNREEIEEILSLFLREVDACIINAGTSAGTEDFTEEVIRRKGEVILHGVSMMPGKPFLFGLIEGKPIFGIPGYPVSAAFCFREFVIPFFEKIYGKSVERETMRVKMAYKAASKIGVEELLRVNLVSRGETVYAIPLPRGASLISSLSYADGVVRIPERVEGYEEDEEVTCELIKSKDYFENRLNVVGSHDICLSLLREMVKDVNPSLDFVSIHVGSLAGIMAFKKGITDLVTTHILDPEKKVYNIPILQSHVPDKRWRLINIAKRITGIAVRKGNPKNIKGVEDIAREGVKFVNRQFGSGTRVLFDTLLKEKGIEKERIDGYDREEPSHTRVGVLIKECVADCGITTFSVAKLFDLDFIPLAEEDFDLLVSEDFTKEKKFEIIYGIITSDDFKRRLEALGGYRTEETGRVKYVNG